MIQFLFCCFIAGIGQHSCMDKRKDLERASTDLCRSFWREKTVMEIWKQSSWNTTYWFFPVCEAPAQWHRCFWWSFHIFYYANTTNSTDLQLGERPCLPNDPKSVYKTFPQECLALAGGVLLLKLYLQGCRLVVQTDWKALKASILHALDFLSGALVTLFVPFRIGFRKQPRHEASNKRHLL